VTRGSAIAVLDYGIGNLASAHRALVHLGAEAELVQDPEEAKDAAGVVLPGVGAFGRCARALEESGLGEVARRALATGVPFLGICVGLQLLYEGSEEAPGVAGLGVLAGTVQRLPPGTKCPQIQWNPLRPVGVQPAEILAGLPDDPWMYFVHSYAPPIGPETVAVCDYGGDVAAAIEREHIWGTQFHPEKSGTLGLTVLANFVKRTSAESGAPSL
jgi:imidazole glycerol-phosphate synthase subunit HisH